MTPAWGMSETASGVVYNDEYSLTSQRFDGLLELGRPLPGTSIRIVDEQDRLLPEEQAGHLQVIGPSMMKGYFRNPEATQQAFTTDGWLRTGDFGFLSDGSLYLTGRAEDVIIVNGVNYYAYEIEKVVGKIDGVESAPVAACAVRVANVATDELAVFYCPERDGDCADLDRTIRQVVAEQLGVTPAYTVPIARSRFPRTDSGKLQRSKLRQELEAGEFAVASQHSSIGQLMYRQVWRPKRLSTDCPVASVLVLHDGSPLAVNLRRQLPADSIFVQSADCFRRLDQHRFTVDVCDRDSYRSLFRALGDEGRLPTTLVHLLFCDSDSSHSELPQVDSVLPWRDTSRHLLPLIKPLQEFWRSAEACRLLIASQFAQVTNDQAEHDPASWSLGGMVQCLAAEQWWNVQHIDLDGRTDPQRQATQLGLELSHCPTEQCVAYRGQRRLIPAFEPLADAGTWSQTLRHSEPYIITGGLGGIGIELARHLLGKYNARLLILGRSRIADVSDRLASLRRLGSVDYRVIDVTRTIEVRDAFDNFRQECGRPVAGVFHLAAEYEDRLLANEDVEAAHARMTAKIEGALAIHEATGETPECLVVFFSSLLASIGGSAAGVYAAANAFLDRFAIYRTTNGLRRTHSLSWSMWKDVGMSRGNRAEHLLARKSLRVFRPHEAMKCLETALSQDHPHLLLGVDEAGYELRRYLHRAEKIDAWATTIFHPPLPRDVRNALSDLVIRDRYGNTIVPNVVELDEIPRSSFGVPDRKAMFNMTVLTSLQLTTSGKVDRRALPLPSPVETSSGRPRTPIEEGILAIFTEVLEVSTTGRGDNFFELGGHSLLATQVLSRIAKTFGVELSVRVLFEAPTVMELAKRVESALTEENSIATPLLPTRRPRLPAPLSFAQQRLWFLHQLASHSSAYNIPLALRFHGRLDEDALQAALNELVTRHAALRTRFTRVEGSARQQIESAGTLPLAHRDLASLPEDQRLAEAQRLGSSRTTAAV